MQRPRSSPSALHSPLMRCPSGGLRLLVPLFVILTDCRGNDGRKYLIDAQPQGRWIVMEYSNPSCPPLPDSGAGRDIHITESGYGCTSSPIVLGPSVDSCYLLGADGRRTRLLVGRDLQRSDTVDGPNQLIGVDGRIQKPCYVSAEGFWYGAQGSEKGSVMDVLRTHHPECQ